MSKRFTDKNKWHDDWFLSLPNDYRIVWEYMLDSCTNAGRLKKNFKLLNFCCNTNLDHETFMEVFSDRVIDKDGFYFIPKYLKFQYSKGLNSNKPAIIGVKNELIQYGLVEYVHKYLGSEFLIISNDSPIVKDKEKEKDKDKDKDKDKERGMQGGKPIVGKFTLQDVLNNVHVGMTKEQATHYFNCRERQGWLTSGNHPMPIVNLAADMAAWKTNECKFETKNKEDVKGWAERTAVK